MGSRCPWQQQIRRGVWVRPVWTQNNTNHLNGNNSDRNVRTGGDDTLGQMGDVYVNTVRNVGKGFHWTHPGVPRLQEAWDIKAELLLWHSEIGQAFVLTGVRSCDGQAAPNTRGRTKKWRTQTGSVTLTYYLSYELRQLLTSCGYACHCRKTQSCRSFPPRGRFLTPAEDTADTRRCTDRCGPRRLRMNEPLRRRHKTTVWTKGQVIPLFRMVDSNDFKSQLTLFEHHCWNLRPTSLPGNSEQESGTAAKVPELPAPSYTQWDRKKNLWSLTSK